MTTRLTLLGAGRIGEVHGRNIAASGRATLGAIYDVDRARAEALAAALGGAAVAPSVEAALDAGEAVLICTSTDTHVELIELAASRGRSVFCEKPIDLDLARVDGCLERVEAAGVPLMIGFNRRFDPHFRALKAALAAGELGRLEVLRITSRDPEPPPPEYVALSGGLFRDMMIHDLDMARFLMAEPLVEVYAAGSCLVDPAIGAAGDVDTAVVVLRGASGALCSIDNSRRAVYGYDQRIEAFGAEGMLQADNPRPTTLRRADARSVQTDRPPWFFLERYAEAYRAELDHFLDVIEGKAKAPSVDGADGRAALVLAEAAARSLAEGRPVRPERSEP